MKIDLTSKTALVTGSAQGIGFAIARGLANAGASVVLNGLTKDEVDRAIEKLQAELPNAEISGVVANVATAEGAAALKAAVPAVDILVNNAGIYGQQDFFDTPDDIWLR